MIETRRLILRGWREADRQPLQAICSDAQVMEFIGPAWSRKDCGHFIGGQQEIQQDHGCSIWAVERKADGALIGCCGIKPGPEGTPVADMPDLGWRLASQAWGQGYAREAAMSTIAWGFENLPDAAIWAKTVPANARSRGLMMRLGMDYVEGGDFDHPALCAGDPLRRHVVYRINRPQ